jgi:hypothetical protein
MPQSVKDLFDHWELVWHEGQFDLVPVCVASHYIRHDEQGDRTVSRDAYAAEIAKIRQERPDIRVVVYDHHSKVTAHGFALRSNGPTPRPANVAAGRVCRATGSRMASWLRRGFQCSL